MNQIPYAPGSVPPAAQQLQAAIVAASQSGTPPAMPMLGMSGAPPSYAPPAPPPVKMPSYSRPPTPDAQQQTPEMLGVQGTPGVPPPQMLAPAGSYVSPNAQPPPPTFPWGGDPSGLGGAAANLGGYMGF